MLAHFIAGVRTLTLVSLVAWAGTAGATGPSPEGLWHTIDDADGRPRGEVRITIEDGVLTGRIVGSLRPPDEEASPLCLRCPDERRNQPLIGMAFLTGVRQSTDDPLTWGGGEILDPDTGETYDVRLRLTPSGDELNVRGYIGIPLLGRSQTWQRVE